MSKIELADIRPGDTIKASQLEFGVVVERTGVVAYTSGADIRTNEHGNVFRDGWAGDWSYELIDRPKQPLPTEAGTIISSEQPVELGPIALILRDGQWQYLNGDSFYHVNSIQNRPWKLLKLVDA